VAVHLSFDHQSTLEQLEERSSSRRLDYPTRAQKRPFNVRTNFACFECLALRQHNGRSESHRMAVLASFDSHRVLGCLTLSKDELECM
jgi:hypothetical protein